MKVVLASVSFTSPYTAQRRMLSLGYIHAQAISDELIRDTAEVVHKFYDCSIHDETHNAAAILADDPDVVGFSCYVWNTPDVLRVCAEVKRQKPEVKIILGGPEVSYHYARILDQNSSVDWVAVNEGEETFRELLRALIQDEDTTQIPGLAQRLEGKPVVPSPRPYCKDLDSLASPYLTGVLDVCDIREGACYQTARGCPFVCSYCDYGRNQPYFEFSLERVRAEMQYFKKANARILLNTDPTFNYSRKRAEAILGMIIEYDIQALHMYEVFPSLINEDLIELASNTACSFIGVGIQSANPETMRNIKRVWKPEKVAPMIDKLKGMPNVMVSCEIIMGLPGDKVEDYKNTVSYAFEREPADIKAFNLAILPRTPLEKEVDKWGIDYDPDIGHEILSTKWMTTYEVLVGKAINDWSRMIQRLVHMMVRLTGRKGGDILEEWAHIAHDAGFHDRVPDLRTHNIDAELVEGLSTVWARYVSEQCEYAGIPDISGPLKAEFQYHFFRRARTWAAAHFGDVKDMYFNMPYPGLHQYFDATITSQGDAEGVTGKETPKLGGDVSLQVLDYDMDDLYTLIDTESLAAATPKQTEYAFFMTPKTGAGCGIIVDDGARGFLELADGNRTVDEIGERLAEQFGAEVGATARKIYKNLESTGVFKLPMFLTDYEEGKINWQSCFPEVHREYH
ncbi:MAG: radical SAM protein [Planctomycetota bacterium]|jgi:radical SAM superfamily enzyme YgiQ (UPF0313 family)|nr:radical SAM protein [Planctomycetota bacterium]